MTDIKPYLHSSQHPGEVIVFVVDGERGLWVSKKVKANCYKWERVTKWSRDKNVLAQARGEYKPRVVHFKLLFSPRHMVFTDNASLVLSFHELSWRILDGKRKKSDYGKILAFTTNREIYFVHKFGKVEVSAKLKAPHTIARVCAGILKAVRLKFGNKISQYSDHIYPEELHLVGDKLTITCGS